MKSTEMGKRRKTVFNTFQQKAKETRGGRLLNSSSSLNCLTETSTKEIQPRKASTPTHDRTALSNSPDISHISNIDDAKTSHPKTAVTFRKPKLLDAATSAPEKELGLEDQLEIKYVLNLQAVFKNELLKSRCSKIDSELTDIQQQIDQNEQLLKRTTERLENISFNKEVDNLHKLHNPVYGQILDTVDETNYEEHLLKLNTKLEQTQNQLKIKNIETPKGGGAQLMAVISETLSAFEKLKMDHDVETPRILKEIKDINKTTVDTLTRGKDNLSTCEDLLLNRMTLEISRLQDQSD